MLKTARLWYVTLCRQGPRFWSSSHFPSPPAWHRQTYILWACCQPLHMAPHLICSHWWIKAKSHKNAVVWWQMHYVECLASNTIWAEVVNYVMPECETGPSFCQDYLDAALVPGPGLTTVQDEHWDAHIAQFPLSLTRGGTHIQVCQRATHKHLKLSKLFKI